MATIEELIKQSENELKGKSTSDLIAMANSELGGKTSPKWQPTNTFHTPAMAGIGGSLYMQGKGIQQKGAQIGEKLGLVKPETVQRITQEGSDAREDLKRLESEYVSAKLGSFIGDAAPGFALPVGKGKLVQRILTGMGVGGVQGASRYTGEDESTLANAATGALVGGAIPAILAPVAKVINAVRGKLNSPINVGAKQGISTTLGEDLGSQGLQKLETNVLERVPFINIQKFRVKQNAEAEGAAKNFLGKYIADGSKPDFWGNKGVVDGLYNQVKEMAGKINVKSSAVDTRTAAQGLLDNYPSIFESLQDQRTKTILRNIVGDTVDRQFAGKILTPKFSFTDMWQLRKGLGVARENAKAQGNIEAVGVLSKVRNAVDQDIDAISNSVGSEASGALKNANDAYKKYVIKYEIIQDAFDKASGAKGAKEVFSPKTFATNLKNAEYESRVAQKTNLFSAEERKEIAGLVNIMQIVKRAGAYMENPPTGNRVFEQYIAGGGVIGAMANAPLTAQVAGVGAIATAIPKFLTTTQAGKRFAVAASNLEPDSPAMKVLVEKVMQGARSIGVNRATQGGSNVPTQ